MTFQSTATFSGISPNRFASATAIPRYDRTAIINPASTFTGKFLPGMPLKFIGFDAGGAIIVDISASNDSAPQYFLKPNQSNAYVAVNGVVQNQFVTGDTITVFQTLGVKEDEFYYEIKTGETVSVGDAITYDTATNSIKTAGATDIKCGFALQSGGSQDIVRCSIKTAGMDIKPTITSL